LLHGGLFEVALLGDQPVEAIQQGIGITAERLAITLLLCGIWRVLQAERLKVVDQDLF
jgi:hypothetical protein